MNIVTKKEQLYAELKVGILEGKFKDKFPSEPEFAKQLNVSRNTLRSVFALLEADGLILRHSGNGTMPMPWANIVNKNILFLYATYPKHFTVDFITPSIFQGVEKAIPTGWGLESCPVTQLRELPIEKATQILKARNICGIIMQDSSFTGKEVILDIIKSANIPTVICYCNPNDYHTTAMPVVAKCTDEAWLQGLKYLKNNGHTQIVTLNSTSQKIRDFFPLEEYQKILKDMGINDDKELILNLPLEEEAIFEAIKNLKKEFTAIYCYSDFYAEYLYKALNKLGVKIPEDISILGYCGFCGGAYFNPPLTTLELNYSAIGSQAIEILKNSNEWFYKSKSKPPFKKVAYYIRKRESFLPLK